MDKLIDWGKSFALLKIYTVKDNHLAEKYLDHFKKQDIDLNLRYSAILLTEDKDCENFHKALLYFAKEQSKYLNFEITLLKYQHPTVWPSHVKKQILMKTQQISDLYVAQAKIERALLTFKNY